MKRILVCLLALLLLAGCANKPKDIAAAEKDLQAIYAQMEPQLPEMMALSDSMMLDLLGIKPEFCVRAIREAGVALVPGSCFGSPGHVRVSCCVRREDLEQAMERLERFVKSL